jgi:hypothetical protein
VKNLPIEETTLVTRVPGTGVSHGVDTVGVVVDPWSTHPEPQVVTVIVLVLTMVDVRSSSLA